MTFLELMPFHTHDFKVISRQALFPIVDGKQEERIVEKCRICGKIVTKLKYGIMMPKLKHFDNIDSFGSKDCIVNYGRTRK